MANMDVGLNGFSGNPLRVLAGWVRDAVDAGLPSPLCMTFASATPDGIPHARTVLSTVIDDESVRFHTLRPSVKTTDVARNARASGVFFWPALLRQVTLHGAVRELDVSVSREAFQAQSPNLRALAWVYDSLSGEAPGATVDPARVREVFSRELARVRP